MFKIEKLMSSGDSLSMVPIDSKIKELATIKSS